MIVNGHALLRRMPLLPMISTKITENGVSHGLSEAGYDIRVKQDIRFYKSNEAPYERRASNGSLYEVGNFCLASSIEEFQMPHNMMAIVHDKSTWARKGLSVFNTVIEPGWNGYLTLELVYHGQGELHIPAGSGIAQVIFHELSVPNSYNGKYQNQENRPVEAIMENLKQRESYRSEHDERGWQPK